MSSLEIIKYGDFVLKQKCEEIKNIDSRVEELARKMVNTMYLNSGIGLAAPQVNETKRLITVDLSMGKNKEDLIILLNPVLLNENGENIEEEGCLSIPDIQEKIHRPQKVIVKGINLKGKEQIIEAEDLLARVFCHEIDHINGVLFIDHLSHLKKNLIKKKLKKRNSEKQSI